MSRALLIGIFLLSAGPVRSQPKKDTPEEPGKPVEPDNGQPDSPGRADISAAMNEIKPKLLACGQQHKVKGTVKIAIKVNPDGTVKSAEIKQSPDTKVNDCIVDAASTITLPKSNKGVTFSYPIILG